MANTQHFRQAIANINTPAVSAVWADLVDDLEAMRTILVALMVKLDADTALDDDDYVNTLTPAALKTKK